ncbi:hypothetical protein [Clostridium sp. AF22-10]|uniref:hypothetical protein n=1 Tax=Clostridium sp. AF22-10 TaxID=2293004 RepID=UPI0015FC8DD7
MTKENFDRAKEIMEDIKWIEEIDVPMGLSMNTMESFKMWQSDTIEKLKSEFDKL